MVDIVDAERGQDAKGSIGDRLRANQGVGPNFGLLRMVAAVAVLVSHSFEVVSGTTTSEPLWIISNGHLKLGTLAVCVFFAMSGFLVTPSLARSRSVGRFFVKRAARLVPALAVAMIGLVFVIGPLCTTLDIRSYFLDRATWHFLVSQLHRTTQLPGVFVHLPLPGVVNGSLWTLKFEALSYVLLAVIGLTALLRRPALLVIFTMIIMSTTAILLYKAALSPKETLLLQFLMLFEFFMAGVTVAILSDHIIVAWPLLLVAAIITSIAIVTGSFFIVGPISMTYLVVGFGVQNKVDLLFKVRASGDYSYGTYLWAFPIQQIVQETLETNHWFVNVAAALPLTLLIAAVSWHTVEKPALDLVSSGLSRKEMPI